MMTNPGVCGIRFDQPGEEPPATIAQSYRNEPDATLAGRAWSWLRGPCRVPRTSMLPQLPRRSPQPVTTFPGGLNCAASLRRLRFP
jgi:hypothetical protein